MPVRPACYIPPLTSEAAAHGLRLRIRRAVMTAVELACLALFVAGALAWCAIGSGL